MEVLNIENLSFGYTNNPVLKEVNFRIKKGEFIALVGGNGTGKSTLLKNILGELRPNKGSIKLLEQPIEKYNDFRKIGYVPQLSIVDQIAFPVTAKELVVLNLYKDFGLFKFPKAEHKKKAEETLINLGLGKYLDTPVNELSGGLKQRTMIARSMVNDPEIIILDEPTAGIDQENRESFIRMIDDLNSKEDLTILLVTHELEEVVQFADLDKIYEIREGKIFDIEIKSAEKVSKGDYKC